ncbi:hypothetical protein LPB142_17780 (plasmid) [Rhodobacter xanthinilyticus]|uniref:DNA2/NAM7 helicase helicase domain-containing protein n=1 Tax=Rhodobacter xanthinilyticus TaxID=1850250 RepID=A0A1D9MHF5_9RHOB|nr:AAA domain-containing protein [Rhodobacter xanthinilyticus]AOZ71305.1 hypothetical protein LPB142_17780 [Rhodobacter xanthinilyticus]
MAFLPFAAIEPDRPDMLMKNVFYGLKAPYDYLSGAKKRMENPDNLPHADWSAEQKGPTFEPRTPKQSKERQDTPLSRKASEGFWVRLTKHDGAELSDAEIRLFTDPEVRKISWIDAPFQKSGMRKPKFVEIDVLAHDPDEGRLHLAALPPAGTILALRPNTYQLRKQLEAIAALQNCPDPAHLPLLRLLQPEQSANWPSMLREPEPDWMVLTDPDRPGASEQRDFVRRALATPDFALMEGPPGSGKTTVICELIAQMARRGKRVLLWALLQIVGGDKLIIPFC